MEKTISKKWLVKMRLKHMLDKTPHEINIKNMKLVPEEFKIMENSKEISEEWLTKMRLQK